MSRSDTNARTAGSLGLFVLLWIPFAALAARFWFVSDDAYISFRYARNWVAGHGLRYNLGDHVPVEGYSNFLWVCLAAPVEWLGLDPTFWMPLACLSCGTILLYLVFDLLGRRWHMARSVVCLATLFLACSPCFVVWASGGLETMGFALLLFLTFDLLFLRPGGVAAIPAALAALGVALIRVEGIFWVALFVPLAFISWRMRGEAVGRRLLKFGLIVGAGFGLYFGWRFSYYESLWSNTVYAKVSLSGKVLARGYDYLAVQWLTLLTPFLLLPGSLVALKRERRAIGLCVATVACGVHAFALMVSGDFMAMGRLLVPGLAFETILFAWLLTDAAGESRSGRRLAATLVGTAIVVIGALPAFDLHLVPARIRRAHHFRWNSGENYRTEFEQWRYEKTSAEDQARVGRTLRACLPDDASVVAGAIGAVGYESDLFIWDGFGLVTAEVARREVTELPRVSPGHDKVVPPTYFTSKQPTVLQFKVVSGESRPAIAERLSAFAAGLRRKRLDELYAPDFVPLAEPHSSGREAYVALWRRIGPGLTPERAWSAFRARIDELRSSR